MRIERSPFRLLGTLFLVCAFPIAGATVEERIETLLSQMTVEEKLGQLSQYTTGPENLHELIAKGEVGCVFNIGGAAETNELQRIAVEKSRLKIPLLIANDVIHGYRTIFPIPPAIASTWDPASAELAARIAAREARAAGTHWTFAPMVDIARDPRWGRIAEGAGEDPYLGAAMAAAYVRGFQGTNLNADDAVLACAKHFAGYGAAEAGRDYNSGTYIAGIEPLVRRDEDVTTIRQHATSGDFKFASSDGRQRGIVLGRLLADRLQAYVGDTVGLLTLPSSGTAVSASTGMPVPRHDRLEVTGIFDSGLYEYDNAYVYVSLATAQELSGLGDDVTGIEIKTRDRWDAASVASKLDETFAFQFRSVDWQEQNSTLFQALKLEKLGMAVILLLIIIVAAFNIVSNLTMLVADKTKEIGILKAMGMKARSIRRVFLTQGLVIGVVGTVAGLVLGIAMSLALGKYKFIRLNPEIYFIDHLPVQTEVTDVALTVLASIAIAAIATIYPAQQAARLYPIDAIRHE